MMKMLFIKIVLGFYSICAVFVNGSPTLKDLEFVKGLRSSPRKREARSLVPEFEDAEDEIIAKIGETVKMPCSVKNLGDNVGSYNSTIKIRVAGLTGICVGGLYFISSGADTLSVIVSWIRQKSLHILTSGLMTFTGDSRYQVDHSEEDSNVWDLTLTNVHANDAGVYECQINIEPKLKRAVHLMVTSGNGDMNFYSDDNDDISGTQIASVIGPAEKFVQLGSTVTITCHIKLIGLSSDSVYWLSKYRKPVQWFHSSNLISTIRAETGGVSIETVRLSNFIVSNLIITFATYQDSGVYICKPIKGPSANVTLTILQNEEMEAVKPENYLQSNNAMKDDIIVTWKKLFLLYTMLLLFIRFPA